MVLVIMFTQTSVILAGAETSDADLIGKWSFNEEGGDTVYDLSGNGADLHAVGGAHTRVEGAKGKTIQFDAFDGVGSADKQWFAAVDKQSIPQMLTGANAVTVMGMFRKRSNLSAGDAKDFVYIEGDSNIGVGIRVNISSTAIKFLGRSYTGDGFTGSKDAAANLEDNSIWHHLAVVIDYSAKNVKIYLDGEIILDQDGMKFGSSTYQMGLPTKDTAQIRFGCDRILVDEISLYKRGLTAEEIKADIPPQPLSPPIVKLDTSKLAEGNALIDLAGMDDNVYLGNGGSAEIVQGINGTAVKNTKGKFEFHTFTLASKLNGSSAVSAGTWFKGPITESDNVLWHISGQKASALDLRIQPEAGGTFTLGIGGRSRDDDSFCNVPARGVTITPDTWHHLMGVIDFKNKTGSIYLDGELIYDGTGTFSNFKADAYSCLPGLGHLPDTVGTPGISIDTPVLYNRAVTEDEVKKLFSDRPVSSISFRAEDQNVIGPISGDITATADVVNQNDGQMRACVVFALKQQGDVLKDLFVSEPLTLAPQESKQISHVFPDAEEADTVFAYTLEGMDTLRPISVRKSSRDGLSEQSLKLPSIFSDGMVVQRGKPFVIWGQGVNGTTVSVTFNGETKEAGVRDGEWKLTFDAAQTLDSTDLSVTDGINAFDVHGIQLGQVWVLGGQSNIAHTIKVFRGQIDSNIAVPPVNSNVHMFDMNLDFGSSIKQSDVTEGHWSQCTENTQENFSYTGYLFADQLQKELNEPVAILQTGTGGTYIASWMSKSSFDTLGVPRQFLSTYVQYTTANKFASGLYNAKVYPISGYSASGFIWYQGEADNLIHENYAKALPTLIDNWREDWNVRRDENEDLPFLIVQLPRFNSQYQHIREVQWFTQFTRPNVTTITSIDSGEAEDIHPSDKAVIADRLVGAALSNVYGKPAVYRPPVYQSMTVEGNRVILTFRDVGEGLRGNETLTAFEISADAAPDTTGFTPAQAEIISENQIAVWADGITSPAAVRYAWSGYPEISVYNSDNIPLVPFRTNSVYSESTPF